MSGSLVRDLRTFVRDTLLAMEMKHYYYYKDDAGHWRSKEDEDEEEAEEEEEETRRQQGMFETMDVPARSLPRYCHAVPKSAVSCSTVQYSTITSVPRSAGDNVHPWEKKATMCDCALPPSRERDRSISVIWWRSSSCTVPTTMISRRCRWSPMEADGRRYFHLTLVISRAHEVNSAR